MACATLYAESALFQASCSSDWLQTPMAAARHGLARLAAAKKLWLPSAAEKVLLALCPSWVRVAMKTLRSAWATAEPQQLQASHSESLQKMRAQLLCSTASLKAGLDNHNSSMLSLPVASAMLAAALLTPALQPSICFMQCCLSCNENTTGHEYS